MKTRYILPLFLAVCCVPGRAQTEQKTDPDGVLATWTDQSTNLMWTKQDNGTDLDWNQATAYCHNLSLGGFSDWRLPTIEEFQAIYDPNASTPAVGGWAAHIKGNLKISGEQWSSSAGTASGKALFFGFHGGNRGSIPVGTSTRGRALCVRRSEK